MKQNTACTIKFKYNRKNIRNKAKYNPKFYHPEITSTNIWRTFFLTRLFLHADIQNKRKGERKDGF